MHRNVELLIGRMATDARLRRRFAASPEALLRELSEGGLELTAVELAALAVTQPSAFAAMADALDARLRRYAPAAPAGETQNPDPNQPEPASPTRQERPQ